MLKIIQNLEALYNGAKTYDDSEVLRTCNELTESGVPIYLQNKILQMAYHTSKIENLRGTIVYELRLDQLSLNLN